MASKLDELMALAVIAADIRAGDTAEFYVARRPVSEHNYKEALATLQSALKAVVEDGDRLDWLRDTLFEHKWNGVVGKGCAVQWQVAPDFRFKQRELSDDSGIMAGDFRRAIDAARKP